MFKYTGKFFYTALLMMVLFLPLFTAGQTIFEQDTTYFVTYPDKITTRFYFSKKYTAVNIPAINKDNNLEYRPNTPLTMGLGATYKALSLNLSYGFGFLNGDDEKGKTKSIDLEVHVYPKKWVIDLIGMRHKGLFINPKGYAATDNNSYYYRQDATMLMAGLAVYRLINSKRFSFNAVMIQSEWQKKSAGSFLYGGEVYYSSLKADSSLIPATKATDFRQTGLNNLQIFTAGAGAGYAYTLVVAEHFFATASAIANLDLHVAKEKSGQSDHKRTAINPSFIYKAAIGYNNDNWNISANWAANTIWIKSPLAEKNYMISTGNYRLIFAKRFNWKKR